MSMKICFQKIVFLSNSKYLVNKLTMWSIRYLWVSRCVHVQAKEIHQICIWGIDFFHTQKNFSLLLFSFFTFCVCVFVRVSRIYLPQKKLILPRLSPVSKEEYCFVKENEFSIVKDHRNYVCDFFSLYFFMLLIFWILHFRGLVF